uniref:tRNA (32-2'-O)-methyltransferase regulator THADA n=1 Tax=Pseudonaja textilis TaxID=8673 RepID=A0A670XVR5_PSETE
MALKKKKDIQVDSLVLEYQQLERLRSVADVEGENLASLLLRCAQLTDGIQQINLIKQIVPLLEKMDSEPSYNNMIKSCLDILGIMFLSLDIKNPLKKVLASCLNDLPELLIAEATDSFVVCLKEELATTNFSHIRKTIDNLASCVELINIVSMTLIQKVLENIEECFWKKLDSPIWQCMCGLLNCFICSLSDRIAKDLLQTVQTSAGLAVVLFIKTMFQPVERLPCLVSAFLLKKVKICINITLNWFVDSCGGLCTAELSDSVLLFLCHGALAMLNWKDHSMGENGEKLLLDIASVLLTLSTRLKESVMAASLSRILAIWTSVAMDCLQSSSRDLKFNLHGKSETIGKMLDYVYAHWEHPLDAVRHQTKLIFKNLLQIHQTAVKESIIKPDPFFSELTESLLGLEWHVKGKYSSLGYLVECIGIDSLLEIDRTIPVQILAVMNDQSFAPYASDLLEIMFVNHKRHLISTSERSTWIDSWHETWVSPLLLILCDGNPEQATYVTDYYLPKLLKCSPESLNYMIKILQISTESNVGALGALMACLRTARAHGHLQFAVIIQDGLVPVNCIKQGLVHQHDEVRIDALGLLCESHRSTEVISIEEMQLIQFFISYNLNNQSAAVRQQICSLLKKVISKHECKTYPCFSKCCKEIQYNLNFMNILFESLFPGSSHSSRFTALTLLGTIADIFPNSEGQNQELFQIAQEVDCSRAESLLHCFASTFEEVKTLAFDLLMKLHPFLPYFQDPEKLQPLFQVAMQLSRSSKPYDCVTASYLLNFLIHQKGLLNICSESYQPLGMFQPNEDLPADSLEKNTLSVIKYLLENLEREILQAEKSLLHAAASFPMYGRVHCITGALCQLNHMTLTSEWKEVVTKLILMSYKLSAVVSPVVQSSSPEGLIPMDTDLETSARLQSILLEIQPCDTNDYFTETKLLKECYRPDCGDGRAPDVSTKIKGKEQHTSDVTAQMVLVCCWRSMKEVSLLLGKLCQLLPVQMLPSCSDALITMDQVKDIGEYFKNHLLKSRHRGAFELAYAGFIKLTEVFSRSNNEELHKLPQQWLYNVLEEIKCSDPSSKLCVTRRSAGIPFYIQALLASEPKKGKASLLKMTMKSLISLALPSDIPSSIISQVHALNILRALFKDTRLGENIIPYVADGMQAAILGFTSSVWAVRNSSTLLFSTLITRIFGVKRGKDENSKKNRMTGREFFTRFPSFYPFLLSQLEQITSTADSKTKELKLHPGLFLLLLVLSKLYPSPMDGTYSALSMASFVPLILRCGNSPVYRSRELAGRALVPFVMLNLVPQTVSSLLAGLPDSTDPCIQQNAVHGTLLQVSFGFLHNVASVNRLNFAIDFVSRQNPCLVTRAAYLDVLVLLNNYVGKAKIKDMNTFWGEISTIILESELATGIKHSPAAPGLAQFLQSITRLFTSMCSVMAEPRFANRNFLTKNNTMKPGLSVEYLLHSNFCEVRLLVLETILLWLNQMNAEHVMEEKGNILLNLLSGLEETLIKIAVKEKHPECFCKVTLYFFPFSLVIWTSIAVILMSETKQWLELVSYCCEDEQQTDLRLAAAEILVSITSFFLTDQKLPLGLSDTLFLWRCVVQLLQSEEQIVRDTAVGVIRVALSQENTFRKTELDFHVVNAALALDLAFSLLCELLQLWGQTGAGVSVLLEWLLKEDDLKDLKSTIVMGNDYLFDKGQANFWAEKLTEVRQLSKHLLLLIPVTHVSSCEQRKLYQLARLASDQAQLVTQLLKELPPTPEFSQSVEFTKLAIQNERILLCLKILSLLEVGNGICKS